MIRFPPKRILVPIDLTDLSLEGWKHAAAWGKRFGAVLEAVYTDDLLPSDPWGITHPALTSERKEELTRHVRSKIGNGHKIHVVEGDPLVNILRLARTLKPDLIVMATHGRTGFDRLWAGSVTEALVRLSPVPILVVRGEPPRPIRGVLVPVNFTDYSEYGFTVAAGVATAFGARATGLHVTANPEKCPHPNLRLRGMIHRLPREVRDACKPRVVLKTGDPTKEILTAAKNHDLLVVVAHRKSLLKDFVLGTTAERVLRYSPVPVLAVPSPKPSALWQRWVKTVETSARRS